MIPGITASSVIATPSAADADYASVVANLYFDGPNAGTSFTDQVRPWLWTRNGTPTISTAESRFGGASGLFNGTNQYLSTTAHADFNLSGDFTIECDVYLLSLAAVRGIWYLGNVTTNPIDRISLDIKTDGSAAFFAENGSGTTLFSCEAPAGTFTINNWFNVACVRSGNNLFIFKNGIVVATGTATGTPVTNNVFQIGIARNGGLQRFMAGYIDNFRLTKVARYTSNYTPASAAFPETTGAVLDDSWNPLGAGPGLVFSNGDHTIVRPQFGNDSPDNGALSKRARRSGKVYAEATMNRDGGLWSGYFGFMAADTVIANISTENYTNGLQLAPSRGGSNTMRIVREGVGAEVNGAYGSGVVVGCAIDIDAGKAWIRANDDWVTSALGKTTTFNPADPTVTWSPAGRNWRWYAMSPFFGTEVTLNVGATAFARTPPPGFGPW